MEFTTESGIKCVINGADFVSASRLKVAVLKAIKDSGVKISEIDFTKLLSGVKDDMESAVKSGALDSLLEVVIELDCSKEVNEAIFDCLARSTYNGERIIRETFEPEEARGDYYMIIIACLKRNLSPFFKTLISKLQKLSPKIDDTQKQK